MADSTTEHARLVQELFQLSGIVAESHDPVEKVESIFQYLDDCHIPITDKPTADDERAVDLAISSFIVISCCRRHVIRSRVLDASLAGV
jgi:hypothetical protein